MKTRHLKYKIFLLVVFLAPLMVFATNSDDEKEPEKPEKKELFTAAPVSPNALPKARTLFGVDSVESGILLDEISVVAIKNEMQLRNEAVAATIVTSNTLEEVNAVGLKSLSDVVPNFYVPDYGSRITSSIYVRGIGARMDQPSVGLNVDNLPYMTKDAFDFDVADIESMEMLRGPQSTLHGRNTIAGLVNITTLSPMKFQGWKIYGEAGNGDHLKASVGKYWLLGKRRNFGTSVNLSTGLTGGFFKNKYNNLYTDRELAGDIRWKSEWNVSSRVTLRNVFSTSLLRQGGYPYEYIESGEINYNDTCFYRRVWFSDALTVNHAFDKFRLMSITGIQYMDNNLTLDQDFLPQSYFTLSQKKKELAVTEDIVFKGINTSSPYNWLAGVFAFYKSLKMQAPVVFKDDGIRELIEKHRNDANPTYPIEWDTREFPLDSRFRMPDFGVALYHESKLNLERWHFTAGIRLDYEETSMRYHSTCDTGYEIYHLEGNGDKVPYRHVDIDIDDTGNVRRRYFNWMPKVTALYELPGSPTFGGNVYVNVAKGYKSGGFNTQMFGDVLKQRLMNIMGIGSQYGINDVIGYKPEYSWNYELGGHFGFFDDRLLADWDLFYIDCRDQQLTMFPDGNTTTGRIMTNAGRTRSFGAELSLIGYALPNLRFMANYGYTNARFVKFFDGIDDNRNKVIPYMPAHTLFLQGLFDWHINIMNIKMITFAVDARGIGEIKWNEANTLQQPFYMLLGGNITFDAYRWAIQVWGRNLTNTHYNTFYFKSMGNEFLQRGKPLEFGVTIRVTLK